MILENSKTCPILEPPVNNKSVKCVADCVAVTIVASFYELVYSKKRKKKKKNSQNIIMALPWETHGIFKNRKRKNTKKKKKNDKHISKGMI